MNNKNQIKLAAKTFLTQHFGGVIADDFSYCEDFLKVDLVCITENLRIFAILKSNKDSLAYIDSQVRENNKYCNVVYVFLDLYHADAYKKNLSRHLYQHQCIIVNNGHLQSLNGQKYLFQKPPINHSLSSVLSLLWKSEQLHFLSILGGDVEHELVCHAIHFIYSDLEIVQLSQEILFSRYALLKSKAGEIENSFTGGCLNNHVKDIDKKQTRLKMFLQNIKAKKEKKWCANFTTKFSILQKLPPLSKDDLTLVCTHSRKYGRVSVCFKAGELNIPIMQVRLHDSHNLADAAEVFESGLALGKEIVRRWNHVGGIIDDLENTNETEE